LADVLDESETGLAFADSVYEYLIDATWVAAVAPLGDCVVLIAFWADTTLAVDAI